MPNPNGSGLFVTFEGPDGSGKSTQVQLLAAALVSRGFSVVQTREPGGTAIGNGVRSLLLDPSHGEMSPRAETLLYNAARAQLVHQVIRPALAQGSIILCDRYGDSTLAYQGYGHGQSIDELRSIIEYATGGLRPTVTFLLDIDAATGLRRKGRGDWDRMELQALAFHEATRAGYAELVRREPDRWVLLDATLAVEELHARILGRMLSLLSPAHGPSSG